MMWRDPASAREVPPGLPGGIATLGLIECALSFTVIHGTLQSFGTQDWVPFGGIATLGNAHLSAAVALTLCAIALTIGLYRPETMRNRLRLAGGLLSATALAFIALLALSWRAGQGLTLEHACAVTRILTAWLAAIGATRLVASRGLRTAAPRRLVLLGDAAAVDRLQSLCASRFGRRFDPVGAPGEFGWSSLRRTGIWGVVLASPPPAAALDMLLDMKLRGLRVLDGAAFQERHLRRIDIDDLTAGALVAGDGFRAHRGSALLKRGCDLALAVVMLLLALPLMALTAMAIKADSPGPVLYRQQRTGAFGKPFTVLKFRSMAVDAEAGGKPCWAQKHDPRVTRVGRLIRLTRIDELPQLVNVIAGDMSLVGPRPERPHFVAQLEQALPFYRQRSYVKPGLTGWAQVNYPYGASIEDAREKLAYDLYYVKHRSFWLDARILAATIRVVLLREGAR